ncbi:MAG TPA: hypothetical protein VFH27_02615, partial [Longimicrobiaceae bacterium]|nr:hypothetical protein [Longimicrobiaceae bacterium]
KLAPIAEPLRRVADAAAHAAGVVRQELGGAASWVRGRMGDAAGWMRERMDAAARAARAGVSAIGAGFDRVRGAAGSAATAIRDRFGAASRAVREGVSAIGSAFGRMRTAAAGAASHLRQAITGAARSARDAITRIGDGFGRLRTAATGAASHVRDVLGRAADAVKSKLAVLEGPLGKLRQAGGTAAKAFGDFFSAAAGRVKGAFASSLKNLGVAEFTVFFNTVKAVIGRAMQEADRLGKSLKNLQKTATQSGQSMSFMGRLADGAREKFHLSRASANELTNAVVGLAAKTGDVTKSAQAMDSLVNLGAKRGMSTAETLKALEDATNGVEEGTKKLFDKSPDKLFEEYARSVGKTTDELTDHDRAQAVYNETLRQGADAHGKFAERSRTAAGAQEEFEEKTSETAAVLGKALEPARQAWDRAVAAMYGAFTWLMEKTREFVIGIQGLGIEAARQWMLLPIRFKEFLAGTLDGLAGWADNITSLLDRLGIHVADGLGDRLRNYARNLVRGLAQERQNIEAAVSEQFADLGTTQGEGATEGSGKARDVPPDPAEETRRNRGRHGERTERSAESEAPQEPKDDGKLRYIEEYIGLLTEARQLNLLTNEQREKAMDLERGLVEQRKRAHDAGDLREEVRLTRQINQLHEVTAPPPEKPAEEQIQELTQILSIRKLTAQERQRALAVEQGLEAQRQKAVKSGDLREEYRLTRLISEVRTVTRDPAEERRRQLRHVDPIRAKDVLKTIQAGAEQAAAAMSDAFTSSFELIFSGMSNLGEAFTAMWKGMGQAVLGGIADEAKGHSKKETAAAVSALAEGLGMAARLDPKAGGMFASAAQHVAAAAAWSALAGGAGAASSAIGGGGGAGAGGGAPKSSRDAGSSVAQNATKSGPQIHIYVDGMDPRNPRHQQLTQQTLQGVQERYGQSGGVTYHTAGAR